jgi:septal ring factor EnvC (AmiA/AmiB activator)
MELLGENKLDELEGKIEKLVINYKAVKEEKEKLLVKVQTLEAQNLELREKTEGSKSENELIANKIAKILEKIDKAEV